MTWMFRLLAAVMRDRCGAAAIYVGLALPVLLGAGALSLDLGRVMILHSELQNAADAAALAASRELNRAAGAQGRAIAAAQTLIANGQQFSDASGDVSITSVAFFSSLNPDTAATSDLDSHFVRVQTELYSTTNMFIRVVGGPGVSAANATATAGNHQTACEVTPLMMCNLDADLLSRGDMVTLKGGTKVGAGLFALVDAPNSSNSGAPAIEAMLAGKGVPGCYNAEGISGNPGEKTGPVEELNLRFGMVNPGSKNVNEARAAKVTIKGLRDSSKGKCTKWDSDAAYKALPRDRCQRSGSPCRGSENNIGNNDWRDEANDYWAANHSQAKPSGYPGSFTRYDLYLWETQTGNAPDGAEATTAKSCVPEIGPGDGYDPRMIYVAVVDCGSKESKDKISQNDPVVPLSFARFFLTEPVTDTKEIFAEFIDIATPDNSDGKVHDIIQLYR